MEIIFYLVFGIVYIALELVAHAVLFAVVALGELLLAGVSTTWSRRSRKPVTPELVENVDTDESESHSPIKKTAQAVAADDSNRKSKFSKAAKVIGWGSAGLFAVSIVGVLVINTFFFDSTVRWLVGRQNAESNIQIEFSQATGSLLTGNVSLTDAKFRSVRSDDHKRAPSSEFDLTVGQIDLDINISKSLRGEIEIEKIDLHQLRGSFKRLAKADDASQKKPFLIQALSLKDVQVEIEDHTGSHGVVQAAIEIEDWHSQQLRSEHMLFDTLLQTNATGTIEGAEFQLKSSTDQNSHVVWQLEELPVTTIAPYLKGASDWISEGTIEVQLNHEMPNGASKIQTNCAVILRDIKAEVPADASKLTKVVAVPTVAFLNRSAREIPLTFDLDISEQQFQGKLSLEATGLLKAIGAGLTKSLSESAVRRVDSATSKTTDAIQSVSETARNKFDAIRDRFRKSDNSIAE